MRGQGQKQNGRSVSLGVQMGCHSRSIPLIREDEYEGKEKLRPLSPVSLRTKLPEDKVVNQAPTSRMIKKRNEDKVRESPFIRHKTLRDRESWLLGIGSVEKANDASLNMEIDLKNQLSKIISPIKISQNSRGLHKPKVSRMPQHLQDEHYEEEYLREVERMRVSGSPQQEDVVVMMMSGGPSPHQQQRMMSESPTTLGQRTIGKSSDKSASSQAAVVGFSIDMKYQQGKGIPPPDHKNLMTNNNSILGRLAQQKQDEEEEERKEKQQQQQEEERKEKQQHEEQQQPASAVSVNVPHGVSIIQQTGDDGMWQQQQDRGGHHRFHSSNSPFGVPHSLVGLNGSATPISDLSDRGFSAGSHLTGLYGDFEDDLISAGSNNEDEYIQLEEKP